MNDKENEIFDLNPVGLAVVEEKPSELTKTDTMRIQFESERVKWKNATQVMARKLLDMGQIVDLQIDLHTERANLLEYKYYLLDLLTRLHASQKTVMSKKTAFYRAQNAKTTITEATKLAEADVAQEQERYDILKNHVSYLDDTIGGIEHMIYGLKHRKDFEEYRRK
jgi:predicted  nucleic acid-binding Zn-ribbon protein